MGSSASWRLVRQGEHAPFEVSGDTIVGRSRQADLCLQEGFVSRRHARLWLESGRLMVEDLGSANGTFVNGERLTEPLRLAPGDCLTFDAFDYFVEAIAPRFQGDPNATGFELPDAPGNARSEDRSDNEVTGPARFSRQPDPAATQPTPAVTTALPLAASLDDPDCDADFDLTGESATLPPGPDHGRHGALQQPLPEPPRTPVVHAPDQPPASVLAATVDMRSGESRAIFPPSQMMSASAEHAAQGPSDPLDPSAPALLATSGPLEGSLIHLEPGRVLLGRGVECDIWIDHPAVSRRHLEIFLSAGRCRVRQLEGAHGALLNGNFVGDVELVPGDVLRVGSVEFVYDSIERLTQSQGGLPPWVWMLVGFIGAGAILAGLFMFVL